MIKKNDNKLEFKDIYNEKQLVVGNSHPKAKEKFASMDANYKFQHNRMGYLTISRFGKFATMGITLGECSDFNDTNTIFGEVEEGLESLEKFIYRANEFHDGTTLLKWSDMELVNNPFEEVCKIRRREIILGLTAKQEKKNKEKQDEKKKDEYIKHKSSMLNTLLKYN